MEDQYNRRKFLSRISIGLGGFAATVVSIPIISALFAPLLKKKKQTWRTVGNLKDFEIGTTSLVKFINADPEPWAGITAKSAAWLRRDDQQKFTAFSVNCTHLGCPVRWVASAELFMCPCHGGVYYKDGSVAAGPPPKSMTRYQVRVHRDMVQIKTSPVPITEITA